MGLSSDAPIVSVPSSSGRQETVLSLPGVAELSYPPVRKTGGVLCSDLVKRGGGTLTSAHMDTLTNGHICTWTHTRTHMHTRLHAHIDTHGHTQAHVHTDTHANTDTHIHAHTHSFTHS